MAYVQVSPNVELHKTGVALQNKTEKGASGKNKDEASVVATSGTAITP